MGNVLSDDKQQQVMALGRLGWSLRRIEQATGVRRETASAYLKAAGIRACRGRRRTAEPTGSQNRPIPEVSTDSGAAKTGHPAEVSTDLAGRPHRAGRRPRARASRTAS